MKKYILSSAIGLLLSVASFGQQLPVLQHYVYNPFVNNPAFAGARTYGSVYLGHKNQWTKMPDAPVTDFATLEFPLKKQNIGLGLNLFSDRAHLIRNIGASCSFAYHLNFNEDRSHGFSVGVSAGVLQQRIDFSEADVVNQADMAILRQSGSQPAFDISAGLQYHYKGLTIGASVPRILNSTLTYGEPGGENKFELARHIFASAGYRLMVSDIRIEPILALRVVTGLPLQYEGNLILGWKDIAWVGAGYRTGNGFSSSAGLNVTAGTKIAKHFTAAYTFETPMSGGQRSALGFSHEFTVAYHFGGSLKEKDPDIEKMQRQLDTQNEEQKLIKDDLAAKEEAIDSLSNALEQEKAETAEKMKAQEDRIVKDVETRAISREDQIRELIRTDASGNNAGGNNGGNGGNNGGANGGGKNGGKNGGGGDGSGGNGFFFKKMASIYFDYNSNKLSEENIADLKALMTELNKINGQYVLYIAGRASPEGDANDNLRLSTRRAAATRRQLEDLGLTVEVIVLSYGEDNADKKKAGEDKVKRERRVDIYVVGE